MLSQAPCTPSGSQPKREGQVVAWHAISQEGMEKNYPQKKKKKPDRSALLQETVLTDLVVKNKSTDIYGKFSSSSITGRSQPEHKRSWKPEFLTLFSFSDCFSKKGRKMIGNISSSCIPQQVHPLSSLQVSCFSRALTAFSSSCRHTVGLSCRRHAVVQEALWLYFHMFLENRVMLFSFQRRGGKHWDWGFESDTGGSSQRTGKNPAGPCLGRALLCPQPNRPCRLKRRERHWGVTSTWLQL